MRHFFPLKISLLGQIGQISNTDRQSWYAFCHITDARADSDWFFVSESSIRSHLDTVRFALTCFGRFFKNRFFRCQHWVLKRSFKTLFFDGSFKPEFEIRSRDERKETLEKLKTKLFSFVKCEEK